MKAVPMKVLKDIINGLTSIWREIRRLILVLWLCRISTLSAVLALLLAFLPQVQDLYTEITFYQNPSPEDRIDTILFWLLFYCLAFLWAFTVHYCARTVLSFETWPLSQKDAPIYAYWIESVPRYLGWVCILAIFLGQVNALHNLQIDNDQITRTTSSNYAAPLGFVLLLIIGLQTARRKLGKSTIMISGLAIIYWVLTAYDIYSQPDLSEAYRSQVLHNLTLPLITILWGVLFYYFVAERRKILNFMAGSMPAPHRFMLHATRRLSEYFPVQIRPMHTPQLRQNAPKFLPFKKRGLFRFEAPSENVRGLMLGLFCLTLIMLVWLTFAVSNPATPPFGLKRALLLPVLLGLWVPLLTSISFISNQIRFPLLTSFIFAGIALSWGIGDNHDIDLAAPLKQSTKLEKLAAAPEKLQLKKALELWMSRHNCLEAPRACPPPLIIAASGGASRSAFYVATVLGELHDKPKLFWPSNLPGGKQPQNAKEVKDQIFAISSVSGGSLGSALYTALLRAEQASLFPGRPCNAAQLRKDKLLFSIPEEKILKLNFPVNWKNCLQAITAGDFLSPTMISYTFRDNLAISSLIGFLTREDRAKALENAWAMRERRLTERTHLMDPLLSFQPTRQLWVPLLLFNATSVMTGKRLIASPLAPSYSPEDKIAFAPYHPQGGDKKHTGGRLPDNKAALFPDSLDLHDLLNRQTAMKWQEQQQSQFQLRDITLAKAVSLSARFPLISPHANIKSPDGRIIDRVVDGGYFDNSGMLTALELSRAIKTLSNGALKPILIQISNHPVSIKTNAGGEGKFICPDQSFTNRAEGQKRYQLLPEITSVTSALLNARIARGSHAIALAHQEAGPGFVHFQVAGIRDELGASKKLSMSWWLSKSVQNALNNQINWQQAINLDNPKPLKERLNPSFCAIKKFRRAQRTHWKNIANPPVISRTLGLNR